MCPLVDRSIPLSIHRAFVVQFHLDVDIGNGPINGRVEHIVSGQATLFQSLEGLMIFIDRLLRETRHDASERRT